MCEIQQEFYDLKVIAQYNHMLFQYMLPPQKYKRKFYKYIVTRNADCLPNWHVPFTLNP